MRSLVPQNERHTAQALAQRYAADVPELRPIAQDLREAVLGNAAAKMMNVVQTNVGGEPAQHSGQIIVRAAV